MLEKPDHIECQLGSVLNDREVSSTLMYHVSGVPFQKSQHIPWGRDAGRPHSLFFCEPIPAEGTITGGNYERFLSDRDVEQILEGNKPENCPSRADATFAFPCLHCANIFAQRAGGLRNVYEVRPSGSGIVWCGDMKVRDVMANVSRMSPEELQSRKMASRDEALAFLARDYWRGVSVSQLISDALPMPEFLCSMDLEIVDRVR